MRREQERKRCESVQKEGEEHEKEGRVEIEEEVKSRLIRGVPRCLQRTTSCENGGKKVWKEVSRMGGLMRERQDNVVIISSCAGDGKVVFYRENGTRF